MTIQRMKVQPAEIVLVEDNPVEVMVTKEASYAGTVCNNKHVALFLNSCASK